MLDRNANNIALRNIVSKRENQERKFQPALTVVASRKRKGST